MGDVAVLLGQARQALAAGDAGRALPLLQEAVTLEPGSFEAHMLLGVSLWLSASREEGIHEAQRAVELDSQSAEGRYNLGVMLQMVGQLEEAAQHLEAAVSLRPGHQKAADALQSVRAALPSEPPSDAVALLPSHSEATHEEPVEPPAQSDELVLPQAVMEQPREDTLESDSRTSDPDWFDTLTAALQTIDPLSDAESTPQTREQADNEPDFPGHTG